MFLFTNSRQSQESYIKFLFFFLYFFFFYALPINQV